MPNNKPQGDKGEQEVVDLVPCPNCSKQLMLLPKGYPLFDVQCTGCSFRAQVKTNAHKPTNVVFGAGWEIMDKTTKSGYLVPSLFLNFKWSEKGKQKQEIRFYPFVPKTNLRKYKLSEKAVRANYWMFNYVRMNEVPYFLVYKQ